MLFYLTLCFYRFRCLWEAELARVGPEKASLDRVVLKFQKTRLLVDAIVNFICIVFASLGPVSTILTTAKTLKYIFLNIVILSVTYLKCIIISCYY